MIVGVHMADAWPDVTLLACVQKVLKDLCNETQFRSCQELFKQPNTLVYFYLFPIFRLNRLELLNQ